MKENKPGQTPRWHGRLGMWLTPLLGVCLLLPARTEATDVAAVVADLPDEAAECRYLLSLCQPAEAALKKGQEITAKIEHDQRVSKDSRTQATVEALNKLQTRRTAAQNELNNRLLETLEAATAIRAKHAQPPRCFQKCPHVLRSDLKVWK